MATFNTKKSKQGLVTKILYHVRNDKIDQGKEINPSDSREK